LVLKRKERFESTIQNPKSGASANFATLAIQFRIVNFQLAIANGVATQRELIIASTMKRRWRRPVEVGDMAGIAGFAAAGRQPSFSRQLQPQRQFRIDFSRIGWRDAT